MPAPALLAMLFLLQVAGPPAGGGARGLATPPAADTGSLRHAHGRPVPAAVAVRVPAGAIRIDGRLDDLAWGAAEPITSFFQVTPHEGEPGTEPTEVRLVYDDGAIFVGARMYDSDPGGIRTQLTRRDASSQADWFAVAFDSYHDHNSSFNFRVNASGVKNDRLIGQDGNSSDYAWDPVWDVAVTRDSLGWTAEMRIPLSQLRFSSAADQVWGLQLYREVFRKAEQVRFAWSPQNQRGFVSFFGHLLGLSGLPQPRRVELLPYATARVERVDPRVPGNPFNDGSRETAAAGLDVKYGLTSNLTLDATVNPDFGQVEDDPAFVNLSAFEQFLSERRPFFVEGGDIFRFRGERYFYSRRIGRAPQGSARSRGGFVDQPAGTTILGAAKLSGRTASGWSVGLLNAVTAREFATVDSAGTRFRDQVEPLTNYLVVRGRRDFGRGADQVGFILTAVNRDLSDPRLRFLRGSAYAGGIDFGHRFGKNRYNLTGSIGFSRIAGDTLALQRAQLAAARYYQRPDADHVDYRPTRTSLAGWSATFNLGKEAGAYQFGVWGLATAPGFEVNDAGFQNRADRIGASGFVNRRWTRPGKVFRSAFIGNNAGFEQNFGGVLTTLRYNLNLNAQLLNYWSGGLSAGLWARTQSDGLTRGGPLAQTPSGWWMAFGIESDSRRRVRGSAWPNFWGDELGGWGWGLWSSVDLRPTAAFQVSLQPQYQKSDSRQQYLQSNADPAATETFGRQYIFARIRQESIDLTTRVNLTVSPTLSLQLFTQPFVAVGDYSQLKMLARSRSLDYVVYGETPGSTLQCLDAAGVPIPCGGPAAPAAYLANPNPAGGAATVRIPNRDFGTRSFRGNLVLRYEYRPGSTLFLVWTRSCSTFSPNPAFSAVEDLRHLCQGPSDNVFGIKTNFWLSF